MSAHDVDGDDDEDRASPAAREAAAHIRGAILAEEARVRAAHPLLRHQSAIALAIWALSLGAMAGVSAAYLTGALPWPAALLANALAASLLHELEHDISTRCTLCPPRWPGTACCWASGWPSSA